MCKFCETIEAKKEAHKIAQSWSTDDELRKFGKYMQELTVAIVEHTWYKKCGKKSATRVVSYRNQGLGFKLNYCPECGRRL